MSNTTANQHAPEVVRWGLFSMQVCIPANWTDEQVNAFAEREVPCGTRNGWHIRHDGDPDLAGQPGRVPCSENPGFVHIMLDA